MEYGADQKSKLLEREEDLYARDPGALGIKRAPHLPEQKVDVREDWQDDKEKALADKLRYKLLGMKEKPIATLLLAFSLIFFFGAAVFAFFTFYRGANVVSSENVDISIIGPVSVAGGEELPLEIIVSNNNNAVLQSVALEITYPEGTRSSTDLTRELIRENDLLGVIASGENIKRQIRAVLYGEEGAKKEIMISLEYRVEGSSAVFFKEKKYEVVLSSAPISLAVDSLKEVNSGQPFDLSLTISSNSTITLSNVLVKAEYGFGFSFISANPQTSANDSLWKIGDLRPGEKRIIKVRGKLEGQDDEDRIIRFTIGTTNTALSKTIDVPLLSISQDITIKKPFVSFDLVLNGQLDKDVTISDGGNVRGTITIANNLPTRIIDAEVELKISGDALDKNSVTVPSGLYRAPESIISWGSRAVPDLAVINPGDKPSLTFSLEALNLSGSALRNQELTFEATVKAKRFSESRVPEEVTSTLSKKVKISSNMSLRSRVVRQNGPFTNTGPIPPVAEQATTYTILLDVTNSLNTVSNAEVVTTLPDYVHWMGQFGPSAEKISFNETTGEVLWSVGDIKAGTGFGASPRQVAFQVSFIPATSQVGTAPILIGPTTLRGTDRFTGDRLTSLVSETTAKFDSEPNFKPGDDKVR